MFEDSGSMTILILALMFPAGWIATKVLEFYEK